MKKNNFVEPLTVRELKRWLDNNHISDDIPIGIYLGDYEKGSVAYGIIGDSWNKYDEEDNVTNYTETTGEHCYCSNTMMLRKAKTDKMIVITDGLHIEK